MTREEAIADIRDNIKPVVGGKSLDMAIEALEQAPCTDAISREDALMALTGEYTDSPIEILPKAIKRINALPPVNPAEKVGHWEWVQYDANPEIGNFHCSECRYIPAAFNLSARRMRYCPNCGAKMEVEE